MNFKLEPRQQRILRHFLGAAFDIKLQSKHFLEVHTEFDNDAQTTDKVRVTFVPMINGEPLWSGAELSLLGTQTGPLVETYGLSAIDAAKLLIDNVHPDLVRGGK